MRFLIAAGIIVLLSISLWASTAAVVRSRADATDGLQPDDFDGAALAQAQPKKSKAKKQGKAKASRSALSIADAVPPAPHDGPFQTIRLWFGHQDARPTSWKGGVVAHGARIVRIRPWRFSDAMAVDSAANAWSCGSWLGAEPVRRLFDVHLPLQPRPFVRPGVLVDFVSEAGAKPTFSVTTAEGSFTVDLHDLATTGSKPYLDGRASADLVLSGTPVAIGGARQAGDLESRMWNDYPSVAVSPRNGATAVAYQQYAQAATADRVRVRRLVDGSWQPDEDLTEPGDHYRTAAAYDGDARLLVVYAAQIDGNWDLFGRWHDGRAWAPAERLTDHPQPDLHHRLARDASGHVWLVWQGFRAGASDILARRFDGERWSDEAVVSDSPASDWEPAVTAMHDDGVAVAWDTYDAGQYDVRCRVLRGDGATVVAEPVVRVTSGDELEARASIACDASGRLWIAFDKAGASWGKDTGFWLEMGRMPQGTRLYEGRDIGLAVVEPSAGAVTPLDNPSRSFQWLNPTMFEHVEYPHLTVDSDGRLWMFFRRRVAMRMGARGIGRSFQWELCFSRYDAGKGGWTEPALVADSAGRLDARASIEPAGGALWVAWPADLRPFGEQQPDVCHVFAARLDLARAAAGDVSQARPVATALEPAEALVVAHPDERDDLERLRLHAIAVGGKTYHVYRGDMHRHTETSSDGGGDGSMLDAYRYSIDAAGMDYLLVTDHHDGLREYDWWLREKFNDLFKAGESFVGLYGYERSLGYPNGHRNVFFAERGIRPLLNAPNENARGIDSGKILYPHLREFDGICFSHTSATSMGTDWRDNDPELEPLVEIFQGDRTNYEMLGAPWSADANDTGTQEGGFQPAGYVNLALAKGYKLGFQASSDHLSTHLSYSCILAEANTREALMAAMKQRHSYAATDNILMDVRTDGSDGEHIMGDILTTAALPKLRVHVVGASRLDEVTVIKDGTVVYTARPTGRAAAFEFVDLRATDGKESYYYVRAVQADKRLAWASPVWITYAPGE